MSVEIYLCNTFNISTSQNFMTFCNHIIITLIEKVNKI